jgi:hypothetical protein
MHKVEHIVARTIYARVSAIAGLGQGEMFCDDLINGGNFRVVGAKLIESFSSADTYESEESVTKTELAEKLVSAGPLPFTVCFLKSKGAERVLRGRLLEHESLLGRSLVHDFDVTKGPPLREVDHRSLKWLIVNNVKYILKGK